MAEFTTQIFRVGEGERGQLHTEEFRVGDFGNFPLTSVLTRLETMEFSNGLS